MNRRIPLTAAAAAGGGMLAATAFLQAAAAFADPNAGNADVSDNAFTVDGTTLDPVDTDGDPGYNDIVPLFGDAPLLKLGGGDVELVGSSLGILSHPQDFEVSNSAVPDLGQVETTPTAANILGIDAAQFIVTSSDPADGVDADQLPADGTVYSIANLGFGIENVYEATPTAGVGPADIHDTLVTPLGNVDLSTPFDATKELNPNTPLDGLDTSSGTGLLGTEPDLTPHAFTINDTTFDPGGDGFDKIVPLFGIAPLLEIGGGDLPSINGTAAPIGFAATDNLEAFNSDGMDLGQSTVGVNASNILGIDSTQFTVLQDAPTSIPTSGDIESALGDSADINFSSGAPVTESDFASALADNVLSFNGDLSGQDVINALADTDIASDLGITSDIFGRGTFDPDDVANGITFDPSDTAAILNGIDTGLPAVGTTYSVTDLGLGIENVYEATPNADGTAAASIQDTLVTPLGNFDLSTPYDAIKDLDPTDTFKGLDVGSAPASGGASDNAFTIDGTTLDPGSDGFDKINQLFGIAPLLEIGGGHIFQPPVSIFNPGLDIIPAQQELAVYSGGSEVGSVNTQVNSADILGIDSTQLDVLAATPSSDVIQGVLGDSADIGFTDDAPISDSDLASALAGSGLDFNGDISGQDVINALADTDVAGDLGITPNDFGGDSTFDPADVANGITFDPSDTATILNGLDVSDLPAAGTVYSVTDFGSGFENVYEALPNDDGTAAASIQDTLVTPFGNLDLSTMFDAIKDLMPGDAAAGVNDSSGGSLLSGLLGGGSTDTDDTGGPESAAFLGGVDLSDLSGGGDEGGSFDLFDPSSWLG
jgi:hypothetical protein